MVDERGDGHGSDAAGDRCRVGMAHHEQRGAVRIVPVGNAHPTVVRPA